LQIVDVSDPAAPALLGSYDTPGGAEAVQVVGSTAYVADHDEGLQIVDVSNPAAPALLGTYDTPGWALDVQVVGSTAYVADHDEGLQIVDVSDPSAPTRLGSFDTPEYANDVQVVGSTAYVADHDEGLQIVDVSDPAAPALLGTYDTPGAAWGVQVVEDLVYIADLSSGLQILRVSGGAPEPTLTPTPVVTPTLTPTLTPTPDPGNSPDLDLNHNTGKPGSVFVLNGSLFGGVTSISVLVNGQSVVNNVNVSDGSFTIVLITAANAQPGIYQISVVASSGLAADEVLASTRYTLDADASLREEQPADVTQVNVPETIAPMQEQFIYLPLVMR
jgi:hypothetical protein